MELRSSIENYAARKDAQLKLSKEVCAEGMGQRRNNAARKDALIKFKKEDCATGMGLR